MDFCSILGITLVIVIFVILTMSSFYICYYNSPHYFETLSESKYGTAKELPIVRNPGNSRVCVFMVATPEIDNYSRYTIKQNRKWAESQGYDFVVYTRKSEAMKDLPVNFSKIQYSLDLLNTDNYDYVMYIDADAIVHRVDYDVRHIIKSYMTGTRSILFGEDCYSAKVCSKPGRINSGVFIVKNNNLGKRVLNLWKDSTRGRCSNLVNVFPNCQLIFTNCVYPRMFFSVGIIPFNIINGFHDTLFIKHAMALDDIQRIDEIKKYYINEDSERIQVF